MNTTNEKLLSELSGLHAPVQKWEIDTGTDATGENALWVWAIVDDTNLSRLSQEVRARLRDSIRAAVSRAAESSVPSVYVTQVATLISQSRRFGAKRYFLYAAISNTV